MINQITGIVNTIANSFILQAKADMYSDIAMSGFFASLIDDNTNGEEFIRLIGNAKDKFSTRNAQALYKQIEKIHRYHWTKNYETTGSHLGSTWKPLSEVTLENKRWLQSQGLLADEPETILVETGSLHDSIVSFNKTKYGDNTKFRLSQRKSGKYGSAWTFGTTHPFIDEINKERQVLYGITDSEDVKYSSKIYKDSEDFILKYLSDINLDSKTEAKGWLERQGAKYD